MECLEKTDIILIHSKNLTIADGMTTLMREDDGFTLGFKRDPWLHQPNDFLVIELDALLDAGAKYRLHIEFESMLNDGRQGYYLSSYMPKSGGTR